MLRKAITSLALIIFATVALLTIHPAAPAPGIHAGIPSMCRVGEPAITTQDESAWCVRLMGEPAKHEDMDNGASSDTANGEALVSECIDIARAGMADKNAQAELDSDGWNITECFKAMME